MCELLRFGLIREVRLSTNHFHCITDGSTKLGCDKCILIFMESSLNERLATEALVILGSVQLPTSMSNTGGTWDQANNYLRF